MEDDSKLDEEDLEAQQQEQEALWAVYADRGEGRGRKVVSVTFLDLDQADAGEQQNCEAARPSLKRQSSVVGTTFEISVRVDTSVLGVGKSPEDEEDSDGERESDDEDSEEESEPKLIGLAIEEAPRADSAISSAAKQAASSQGEYLSPMAKAVATSFRFAALLYLAPLKLRLFTATKGYPSRRPPRFEISAPWLGRAGVAATQQLLRDLWEEGGGDCVAFEWIEFLKSGQLLEELDKMCGGGDDMAKVGGGPGWVACAEDEIAAAECLRHDREERRLVFLRRRHECIVCLDDVKGSKMFTDLPCGHIFCVNCLSTQVKMHLARGSVIEGFVCPHAECGDPWLPHIVRRCLEPISWGGDESSGDVEGDTRKQAAKGVDEGKEERDGGQKEKAKKKSRARTVGVVEIKPMSEVRTAQDAFERYEKLVLQKSLDAMSDVTYCPRCQSITVAVDPREGKKQGGSKATAAAASDDVTGRQEGQEETEREKQAPKGRTNALLAQCPNTRCNHIFCARCLDPWHPERQCDEGVAARLKAMNVASEKLRGAGNNLSQRQRLIRLLEDAKQQYETAKALNKHGIRMCPGCGTAIQKSGGCNKMSCSVCHVYFCNLCGKQIKGYEHFHESSRSPCAGKLFDNDGRRFELFSMTE